MAFQPTELCERRTLNSKTRILNEAGTLFEGEFHCGHIHFEDKLGRFSGGMENIDVRLVDSSADFWTLEKNNYWTRLAKLFTHPDVFEYRNYGDTHRFNARPLGLWWANAGGYRIEQIASPQAVTGKLEAVDGFLPEQTVVYQEAFGPGLHCQVQTRGPALVREVKIDDLVALGQRPDNAAFLAIPFEIKGADNLTFRREEQIWNKESDLLVDMDRLWEMEERSDRKSYIRPMAVRDSAKISNVRSVKALWQRRSNRLRFVKLVPVAALDKAVFPVLIDDSAAYYSGVGDGWLFYYWTSSYTVARNSSVSNTGSSTHISVQIGQCGPPSHFRVYRTFFPVDTSGLGAGAEVLTATFGMYGCADASNDDFDYSLVQTTQAGVTELINEDYDQCGTLNNPVLGADVINSSTFTTSDYNILTLNATGLGWIDKTGWTKLGVRSKEDYYGAGSEPTDYEFVEAFTSEEAGTDKDPKLVVTGTGFGPPPPAAGHGKIGAGGVCSPGDGAIGIEGFNT